mmetsp:Transcript_36988/g.49029  ORF Transcript_36988/g.49029 Transcript_36988/m.49029 type:complete len:108 (-) Transcript_36988:483-806(-)
MIICKQKVFSLKKKQQNMICPTFFYRIPFYSSSFFLCNALSFPNLYQNIQILHTHTHTHTGERFFTLFYPVMAQPKTSCVIRSAARSPLSNNCPMDDIRFGGVTVSS